MSLNGNQVNSVSNSNLSVDETKTQLQEYLIKLMELVPNLKNQQQQQQQTSDEGQSSTEAISSRTCLEQFGSLDLNSKEISDLQILQSVLDYIVDLKAEIVCADQRP